MVGETWTNDEKKRLRVMTIDPVRCPPSRLKSMISYFRTPGVSLWAVTYGSGPFHVSKDLGTKIRDFVADGALDWVMANNFQSGVDASLCHRTPKPGGLS